MPIKINPFSIGPFRYEPKEKTIEKKSDEFSSSMEQVFGMTDNSLNWYLSATRAYWLYAVSETVQDAVNRIAWAFSMIRPQLQNKITKEYVIDHPALDILELNDMRFNENQVKFEMMVSYLLTGETFPVLEGNVKYEPVGMFHYPANVCNVAQGTDGYIQTIIASYQNVISTFNRAIETPSYRRLKTYVFETENKLMQMMHILNNRKRNYLRAQSVLESVFYQATTKYYGNIHNSSIMEKASRPGGIWSPKDGAMSQPQYEAFKKEIRESMTGPSNAGANIIAPVPVNYNNLLLNQRDMDFAKMFTAYRTEIYGAFQIPLPLVTTETMTMSNYTKSIEAFFDMAVLPRAQFVFKNLGEFILARFKDGDKYRMVIDEREIPALKERLFARSQTMRNTFVFSQDEMRNECGYQKLGAPTGDIVYIPASYLEAGAKDEYDMAPIAIEGQEENPADEPEESIAQQTDDNQEVIEGEGNEPKPE